MFDVDIDSIETGSVLGIAECEKLFGYTRQSDPMRYQFDLMRLSDWIGKELFKQGKLLTVTCDGSDIRVLTHEQASDYNQKHFDNAIKRMRKCAKRLAAVDIRELTAERVKSHDRAIVKQSKILQMIRNVRGNILPEPKKLGRPVMFKKE